MEGLQIQMDELIQSISDKNIMIKVLSNLPKDNHIILDSLKDHLTSSGHDALMFELMRKKLSPRCETIFKNEEKKENEWALAVYRQRYKGR